MRPLAWATVVWAWGAYFVASVVAVDGGQLVAYAAGWAAFMVAVEALLRVQAHHRAGGGSTAGGAGTHHRSRPAQSAQRVEVGRPWPGPTRSGSHRAQ